MALDPPMPLKNFSLLYVSSYCLFLTKSSEILIKLSQKKKLESVLYQLSIKLKAKEMFGVIYLVHKV